MLILKIILVIVLIVAAGIYFYFKHNVPEGYEDEHGFHYGRKE
jgi:hypothetical protein